MLLLEAMDTVGTIEAGAIMGLGACLGTGFCSIFRGSKEIEHLPLHQFKNPTKAPSHHSPPQTPAVNRG